MNNRQQLINQALIELDSGLKALDEWKFSYNSVVQGIEAYSEDKSIVEIQKGNESFEKVAERLLIKLGY
ncbi:MAG: hypothetical protein ACRCXY_03675 [Fusobacteriaceae bacterium]